MFTTLPIYDHCTAIANRTNCRHPGRSLLTWKPDRTTTPPLAPSSSRSATHSTAIAGPPSALSALRGNNRKHHRHRHRHGSWRHPSPAFPAPSKSGPTAPPSAAPSLNTSPPSRSAKEVEINEKRWTKAGETAARQSTACSNKVEGNAGPQDKPSPYTPARSHQREFVEKYRQAVVGFHIEFQLHRCWVSPETAEKIVKLWKPIAQLLSGEPIEQETPDSCPSCRHPRQLTRNHRLQALSSTISTQKGRFYEPGL